MNKSSSRKRMAARVATPDANTHGQTGTGSQLGTQLCDGEVQPGISPSASGAKRSGSHARTGEQGAVEYVYHTIALEALAELAEGRRNTSARRVARATIEFLGTQGDPVVMEVIDRRVGEAGRDFVS